DCAPARPGPGRLRPGTHLQAARVLVEGAAHVGHGRRVLKRCPVVRQSRHARDEPCLAAGAEAPAVLQLRSSGISRELALHIYVRQRPRVSTTMMRSRDSLRRSALTAPATTATIAIRRSIQPPRISGGREAG